MSVKSRHGWARVRIGTALFALFALLIPSAGTGAAASQAKPAGCEQQANDTVARLLECVTVESVRQHQRALQDIADANGGTRVSGTPGYDASAAYVADQMRAAGLDVTVQEFQFPFFAENRPSVLERVSPNPATFVANQEFFTATYSGSGDVTATVQGVDLVLPPGLPNSSTSGCEPEDFAGFIPGNIALIQRGTCEFALKATNAETAGAAGVIVFNEGQEGRTEPLRSTLGAPVVAIPVIGTSFDIGSALIDATVHMVVDAVSDFRLTSNVFAELPGQTADRVVMVGAHLDSVPAGPGINDNGSGSAAILEVARQMAKVEPGNTVRFAWWGAEELGLLGSEFYVANLDPAARENIMLYLNFDMVGSPNFVRFIHDGDGSTFGTAGPPGSDGIEALFTNFYAQRKLASEPYAFDGRSDYDPFIAAGIPAGGLFTGAEVTKTRGQAIVYGGTAGQAYDPCYHQACDTFENVNLEALDQNTDAIAFATLTYAQDLEPLNAAPNRQLTQKTTMPGRTLDQAT